MPPGPIPLGLVFVLYLAGAKLGVLLTEMPEGIAVLWPPNAVLLAALLRFGLARYWAVAALALAAEVTADWGVFTLTEALLFGAVNVAEATLVFGLLRAWKFDARLATPGDLGKFVLAGPGLGAFCAALAGAGVYSAFRGADTSYAEFVRIWWFGDGLGLLIFTPLLLGFRPFSPAAPAPVPAAQLGDAVAWGGGGAMLTLLWLWPAEPVLGLVLQPVLLLPFVIYIAARRAPRWVAVAIAIAALVLLAAATQGRNPFGGPTPRDAVIRAQEFMFVMSLIGLGLAALLAQVRDGQRASEAANRELRRLNDELEARVEQRTVELRHANRILTDLAALDPLTELYNRRGLMDVGQREVALARRAGRDLAVMMIDLDHFKQINDRLGHAAGDETLKHCAALLRKLARSSDSCARYGGEEFVLLAPETDLGGARVLAERIREEFQRSPVPAAQGEIPVSASLGVTVLGGRDGSLADVLRRADAALYEAKAAGRNRVVSLPA